MTTTPITITQLTTTTTGGDGVFDVLMRAVKAHLEEEFKSGRVKGNEYATVYLGALNLAMQSGMQFVTQQQQLSLNAQLLEQQVALAQLEVQKANIELAILTASQDKVPAEIAQIEAQTQLTTQQKSNLQAEAANISKQGAILDAQKDQIVAQKELTAQQKVNLTAEAANIPKQGLLLDVQKAQVEAQTALTDQQKTNLTAEADNIPKQGLILDAQKLQVQAQTSLTSQQTTNAVQEHEVLVAQECKLRAEYDFTQAQTLKSAEELALLTQKTATERAQVTSLGVDEDSVIGRQKALYLAQTNGFARDAEQKAAKLLADTWSVRRTTDEATVADATNMLYDAAIGRAVTKLLDGVDA